MTYSADRSEKPKCVKQTRIWRHQSFYMISSYERLTLGMRPKTSINKPRTVPLKNIKKEKRKKHLEVKPCLSHAQAKLCSKHNPRTGPTAVWAGLKLRHSWGIWTLFRFTGDLFWCCPNKHLEFFNLGNKQTKPSWSVCSICRKRKCTVMWLQKSHLCTGRSYSKKHIYYHKEGTTKKYTNVRGKQPRDIM